MRVSYPIADLPLGKGGGIETYARNLLRSLQKIDYENEYLLYCSILNEEAFPITSDNFKKIIKGKYKSKEVLKLKVSLVIEKIIGFIGIIFEFMDKTILLREFKGIVKPLILKAYREFYISAKNNDKPMYDLLHFMFTVFPHEVNYGVPIILTIHDIQQEYFPEFFSKADLKIRELCYRPSAGRADHIIAISEFTKKTLIDKYEVPKKKISVVYLGYDKETFKRLDNKAIEGFRAKYNLPHSFLLYPAATWVHKNHLNLLRAYKILREKYGLQDRLILSGLQKENHRIIEEEIKRLGLTDDVRHLGYMSYEELPLLYNAASLMIFPSMFEGFGIPVVEAMAVGLPVVCSNTTSLPEVAGDAALLFDPNSPEDIAEKVFHVYNDKKARRELIQKGFKRAELFTWECTARETLKVYEKVYCDSKKVSSLKDE